MNDITYQQAFDKFARTIKADRELYYSFQSSIAMCCKDAITSAGYQLPRLHELVNKGAVDFLEMLIAKIKK